MRNTVAAIGAVCIVLLAAAFMGSKLLHPSVQSSSDFEKAGVTKSIALTSQPRLEINAPAPPPSPASGAFPTSPQIARTGKVTLLVGDVDRSVWALSGIARSRDGDVFSLQVDNADATARASAEMEIRIPASRFDATLNDVDKVGRVRERSISAQDLTGDITDSSARLRNLQRTESDIRAIMDRSGSVAQVLEAENQLSQVREQIEQLQSQLKSMRGRVAYATVDVSIEAEAASAPVEPSAASELASAWHAAVHSLSQTTVGLVALIMWTVVFAPYILVATTLAFLAYIQVRKRLLGATMAP